MKLSLPQIEPLRSYLAFLVIHFRKFICIIPCIV